MKLPIITRLAILDLWHEWILTLCMVLAIASILTPLLVLLGLKYGTIQTMHKRLMEDPVNREIRPARTLRLTEQWFAQFKQRNDIEFVIPTILRGSSVIRVITEKKRLLIDLVPTNDNDPLILTNDGVIPGQDECVLSFTAAKDLGIKKGDLLNAEVTRTRNKNKESVQVKLRVVAILNPRADSLARIYAPFKFVNDVETYKEGGAVYSRNWSGGIVLPPLSYDGLWLLSPKNLTSIDEIDLTVSTGFTEIIKAQANEFEQELNFYPPDNYTIYKLLAKSNPITANSLNIVKNKLRGKSAIILPFVNNVKITDSNNTKVIGLSLSKSQTDILGLPALPWGKFDINTNFAHQGQALLPNNDKSPTIVLTSKVLGGEITFPINNQGVSFNKNIIVPIELIGILRTGQINRIIFDQTRKTFLSAKTNYHGFRLYAKSIDDIPELYSYFISQDIDVIAQIQEIEKLKILDQGLTRIFWLIAIVGIAGGMAALIASLYASVERKKRDVGVLRLIGLSCLQVFRFPIYQAIIIVVLSNIVASSGYIAISYTINFMFINEIGDKICTLPYIYFMLIFVITTIIATLSSLLAAWKTTAIEPAEAIREE
ncbi:MAG TPA: FtsX-like permease family protein [Thioploca sp.]|nr:FtsX-like permease family protein [Thioploca sp.]